MYVNFFPNAVCCKRIFLLLKLSCLISVAGERQPGKERTVCSMTHFAIKRRTGSRFLCWFQVTMILSLKPHLIVVVHPK